ncbi:AlpA family phage regulatory protein [Shewanella sp. SM43]
MTAGYFPKSVRLGLRLVAWGEERLMNGLSVGYLTLEDVVVNERTTREKI